MLMKKSFKFISLMAIVLLVAFSILMLPGESAASGAATNITATLSDYTADATSTLTLTFELETDVTDGDDVQLTFESDFDPSGIDTGSVTLTSVGGNPTLGTVVAAATTLTIPITAAIVRPEIDTVFQIAMLSTAIPNTKITAAIIRFLE